MLYIVLSEFILLNSFLPDYDHPSLFSSLIYILSKAGRKLLDKLHILKKVRDEEQEENLSKDCER
jgi:hypothetical protein